MTSTIFKSIAAFIGFFLIIFAIGFMAQGTDFVLYKIFAPARANVEREVFENTQSYVEGKRQDLLKYYQQYNSDTSESNKQTIKFVVQQQFANFPEDKIESPQLRIFLEKMKY